DPGGAAAAAGRVRRRRGGTSAASAGDGHSPLNDSVQRVAHNKGKAAINVPRLTVHGLRHTSATLAAQLGATLAELQARIGHSTPNMAMRYQHVAAERDAQLAARMSAYATEQASTPSRSG
ncbi:MAG: tyrosine-type recombinase/integrase, partial [Propionicimonas sp.]